MSRKKTIKRTTASKTTKQDPRLARVIHVLDEVSDYNAVYADRESPSIEDLALEMIKVAFASRGAVEIERMNQVLALLWADNDADNYSDEEERRAAMLEIAERHHRRVCKCCRGEAVTS